MHKIMLFTALIGAWTFYETSGGSEFRADAGTLAAPEIVASASALPEGSVVLAAAVDYAMDAETLDALAAGGEIEPVRYEPMAVRIVEGGAAEFAAIAAAVPVSAVAAAPALDPALPRVEVTGSRVNMRSGPGTSNGVVTTLDGGTTLALVSTQGGWSEVRTAEGTTGWMASSLLADI